MSQTIAAGRRLLVLVACIFAMFMAAVEATIVATAMPTIVADLGGFALFSWVFAAYLLAQAVTIPIYGRLADLYGRRRVFFAGAALFLLGSTLCGLAPSMLLLVAFRALQGLGAGAIMPVAQTVIGDIYLPAERAKIQGYLSSVWGFSAIVGPLLGAFIVEHLSWSLIFWINLPIGTAAIVLLAAFLPEEKLRRPHSIDFAGAVLMALGVGTLIFTLLNASRLDWWMLPLLCLSVFAVALLIAQERRSTEPLLPLGLWRNRIILAGNVGGLAIGATMMGTSAFLPTYVQGVIGHDAFAAGVVLAVLSIGWPIASTIAGQLMLVTSYRTTAVAGGILLLLGSVMLALIGHSLVHAGVAATLIGAGMGLCNTTFTVSVQNAAIRSMRGIATASTVFMRMLGSSLGTAILGAVLNLRLARSTGMFGDPVQVLMDPARRAELSADALARLVASVADALHSVFWAGAVIALAAFAAAWLVPGELRPGHAAEHRAAAE
jgi:EmrB/QacA subfamily drug resistance transporter